MQERKLPDTALITGGSSGIGLAIARKFADNNIKVVVADKAESKEKTENILYKICDVGNPQDIDELYAFTASEAGKPDVLVLNAGQGLMERLCEGDPEKWQQVINTNLMGALRCIRAFVPDMLERKKGNVIFISSVSANQPHPYGAVYSASKTALEVIAETLRLETLPHINVTVISPGVTNTNFFENQISGSYSIENLNTGAISPEEIADDVFYAISKKQGTSINKIITRPIAQEF